MEGPFSSPAPRPPSRGERSWLESHGIRPRKRLGQNFLLDTRLTREIVRRAAWPAGSPILEIGAGGGALTSALLEAGFSVTAVEIDTELVRVLEERFTAEIEQGRLRVLQGDVLTLDLAALFDEPPLSGRTAVGSEEPPIIWLAGNLPYQVTTPILLRAFRHRGRLGGAVFMVQREYGERLAARAGQDAYGSLSVWTAAHATSRPLVRAGRSSFWPRPGVESVVIELVFPADPPYPGIYARLERVLRAAFGQRRKTMENAVSHGLSLPKDQIRASLEAAGIEPSARAETLPLDRFSALVDMLPAEFWSAPPENGAAESVTEEI